MYFKCDERISNAFEWENDMIYFKNTLRLLCDE